MATGAPPVPGEFGHRHRERDQQDVLHPGMKRRRHLTEQHPGGLGIEVHRQAPRGGEGVHARAAPPAAPPGPPRSAATPRRGPRPPGGARARPAARPTAGTTSRVAGNTTGWPAAVLGPGEIEVLQQDSPRHPVDGQVVRDHHQLARGGHPQRAQHHPGGRVQPRPRLHHRLVGQHRRRCAGSAGIHRPRPRAPSATSRPAPSSSTRSRSIGWRSSSACSTATTSASVTPTGACTTTVWLNWSTGPVDARAARR